MPTVYSQIQRHRRRSMPNSPSSPQEKSGNVLNAPAHRDRSLSPTSTAGSPPTHLFASTAARPVVPSFAETVPIDLSFDPAITASARISDEHARSQTSSAFERARTASYAAGEAGHSRPTSSSARPYNTEAHQKTWKENGNKKPRPGTSQSPKAHVDSVYSLKDASQRMSSSSMSSERTLVEDLASHKGSSSRFGKGRLNLLNPMSLLARRRATQALSKAEDIGPSSSKLAVPPMPDNYDPRIRGNILHDFSAPRSRRIQSYQEASSTEASPLPEGQTSPQGWRRLSDLPGLESATTSRNSISPKHSPMFKEHFNDDRNALQPEKKGYLHSLATSTRIQGESLPGKLPTFAKKLPSSIRDQEEQTVVQPPPTRPPPDVPRIDPPLVNEERQPISESRPAIPHDSLDVNTPSQVEHRPSTKRIQDLILPKHMSSTSSRFSFQLGGVDSAAEEKLLEEKHKQKAASNFEGQTPNEETDEAEDDDMDYDPDEDNDYEEKIPGVNADAEEDEPTEISGSSGLMHIDADQANCFSTFHFTPNSTMMSPVTTNGTSQPTPRDSQGEVIGFANTTDSPTLIQQSQVLKYHTKNEVGNVSLLDGLGITSLQLPQSTNNTAQLAQNTQQGLEDDIYFDDGEIDDSLSDANDEGHFDERIFDDESGVIPDIPAQNAKILEAAMQRSSLQSQLPPLLTHLQRGNVATGEANFLQEEGDLPEVGQEYQENKPVMEGETSSHGNVHAVPSQPGGLTQDNLAAYHNALAKAANDAATNGRFSRQMSPSQTSETQESDSHLGEIQPGLVSDSIRAAHTHSLVEEDNRFGFEDESDYDLMIAEANAEVLENDDDGFYGQEFGFFARAPGKGDSELVNGGYFGPRGANGVKRKHSAKANFQEPSLTPITERSEWSARNSVASLQMPVVPLSAQSNPSPGLVQLIGLENGGLDDDDMSLSALMRLRRGWGGSQTSINSVGGSHATGSPLAHMAPSVLGGAAPQTSNGHNMSASIPSLTESAGIPESEEEEDEPEVLTMMQNTPRKTSSNARPPTPQSLGAMSPVSGVSAKGKSNHSRTSSGAESISYVKDPEGSGRWLLERRRTGDDGELELIGREYLAGARI